MPPIDPKHAAVVVVPMFLILGLFLLAPPSFWESKKDNVSAISPEMEMNQLFEREAAAAKAEADANAVLREEEMKAAEAALNNMSADTNLLAGAEPVPELDLSAASIPVPVGNEQIDTAAAPTVPDGPVVSKDGHVVDVNALIDSVKAARRDGR